MGAFGAILYSSRLRLNSILALSPQYTISESFDQRWSQYDKKITWNYRMHNAIDYLVLGYYCDSTRTALSLS